MSDRRSNSYTIATPSCHQPPQSPVVGTDHVGLRMSPDAGMWDAIDADIPELCGALLAELVPLGPTYVHLAGTDDEVRLGLRRAWPGTPIRTLDAEQSDPVDLDDAERWLAQGAHLVSFGRAYLANPELVERFRADLPLAEPGGAGLRPE